MSRSVHCSCSHPAPRFRVDMDLLSPFVKAFDSVVKFFAYWVDRRRRPDLTVRIVERTPDSVTVETVLRGTGLQCRPIRGALMVLGVEGRSAAEIVRGPPFMPARTSLEELFPDPPRETIRVGSYTAIYPLAKFRGASGVKSIRDQVVITKADFPGRGPCVAYSFVVDQVGDVRRDSVNFPPP